MGYCFCWAAIYTRGGVITLQAVKAFDRGLEVSPLRSAEIHDTTYTMVLRVHGHRSPSASNSTDSHVSVSLLPDLRHNIGLLGLQVWLRVLERSAPQLLIPRSTILPFPSMTFCFCSFLDSMIRLLLDTFHLACSLRYVLIFRSLPAL